MIKTNYILKIIFILILVISLALPSLQGLATTPREQQQVLQLELDRLMEELAQVQAGYRRSEEKERAIRSQIANILTRIRRLDTQIHQGNLMVRNLETEIKDTQRSIEETILKITNSRARLALVLRAVNNNYQRPLIEIFLNGKTISDFFNNLTALEILNLENKRILEEIKDLRFVLEEKKEAAEGEKEKTQEEVAAQRRQRDLAAAARAEQERLAQMTRAEQQEYLRKKAEIERRAAEIRTRLFELVDIPDAPTFGEALELAQAVQIQTGIRPAFLLAIITQESALGRNVGRCHLIDFQTGESIHVRTGARMQRGMHPRRDIHHFLNITQQLGRDPRQTLISCPMEVGFGGAMGPAQFIPSTWMNRLHILEPFIQGTPDPWNIRHAFLASALYLRDLGGLQNERNAALRYFAGGNWNNPRFAFYGNQVVQRTNCLQTFIDHNTMTPTCERLVFIPR